MEKEEILKNAFLSINIPLGNDKIYQFMRYYHLLIEKNKVMNLTSITEFCDVVVKHFVDSLMVIEKCGLASEMSLIDVGTGAGFPGIPLKIVFPELDIVLMDSLNKRVGFLNDVINKLSLENIIAVHGRAEDFGRNKKYREKFDVCVSRAVANLSVLVEYCLPFVKVGGQFVAYKSGEIDDELLQAEKSIACLGGKRAYTQKFILPDSDIERSFVVIDKIEPMRWEYPRKAGIPAKNPI